MRSLINPFSVLRHVNLWDVAAFDVGGDAGPDGDPDVAKGMVANTQDTTATKDAPAPDGPNYGPPGTNSAPAPDAPTSADSGPASNADAGLGDYGGAGFDGGDFGVSGTGGLGEVSGLGDYGNAGFDGGDSGISSVGAGFDSGIGPEVGYDDGMVDPGLAAGIDAALADLESYTPTSSELDSQLSDLGLTNITAVDPMSVADQVAQYGTAASLLDDQNLDAIDAQRQADDDISAAQVLGSSIYDDTILDLVFDDTDMGQLKNSDDTNFTGRYRGKSYVDGLESFVDPVDDPTDLPDSYFDIDVQKSYEAGQALTANDIEQLDNLGFRGALAVGDKMTFEEAVALSKNANSSLDNVELESFVPSLGLKSGPPTRNLDSEIYDVETKTTVTPEVVSQNVTPPLDITVAPPVTVNKTTNTAIAPPVTVNKTTNTAIARGKVHASRLDNKWGYIDPKTGKEVSAIDDRRNGGGINSAGAGFARSGGVQADRNNDGFVTAEEAAAVGGLQGNFASGISNSIGATPYGSGIAPTGLAKGFMSYTPYGGLYGGIRDTSRGKTREEIAAENGYKAAGPGYTMGGNSEVEGEQDNGLGFDGGGSPDGEAPEINVCDEGYAFDSVAGMCMPVEEDVPDVPEVPPIRPIRPIEPVRPERPVRPVRPTGPSTPGLNIRPVTFNQGGFVTPNIDQFLNRMR